jgi:hypothetical protein
MGTGKTQMLNTQFLPDHFKRNKNFKSLFITYQRLLSLNIRPPPFNLESESGSELDGDQARFCPCKEMNCY